MKFLGGRMEILAVVLIWNNEDIDRVEQYIEHTKKMLSSDMEKPFSRTINLPIFCYTNTRKNDIPPMPQLDAERVII